MMTSTHGKEMMANSPRYYEASQVFQVHIEAKGIELDDLDAILADIEIQLSASTAAWGLRYWEEMCGLPVNEQELLETRRMRVLAKLRSFPSARRADIERVIASLVSGYFDLLVYPALYAFYVRAAWDKVVDLDALMKALDEARPAHITFGVVGTPDRMLLLNQAGALVTVVEDLSWQETKTWKVSTCPRFNAAGAVETVTEDTSWSETVTFKVFTGPRLGSLKLNQAGAVQTVTTDEGWDEAVTHYKFTGPRLNGPTLQLNGTGRQNEGPKISEQVVTHHEVLVTKKTFPDGQLFNAGPTVSQQQIIDHPGSLTYKRFMAPVAALNARGAVIEDVVDHGWDETITEHKFTGPRLNAAGAVETVTEDTSWSETITFKVFTGPRFNSPTLKLNGAGRISEGPTSTQQQVIQHPGSRTYKRFVAPMAAFNSQARLNAGSKTSEQVVVHHPELEITVKNDGGTLLNRGPTETRQEIINHPDVRTYKKFNPEAGMVLNGKPVLGYMWKKELKEAV